MLAKFLKYVYKLSDMLRLFKKNFTLTNPTAIHPEPSRKSETHNVYVIELSEKVWKEDRKFREANPHYKGKRGCLYVGATSQSPNERFRKHITGYRTKKGIKISSKYVERYGKLLRPSLYNHFNPLTKQEAYRLEKDLANSLKKRGYAVWWN